MKFDFKKGVLATLVAVFVGSSCCWIGALTLWIAGTVTLGTIASYVKDFRVFALVFLALVLLFFKLRNKKKKNS